MYRAVHADRGGRILVTDHPALAFDGARMVPFGDALPLPPDTLVVPIEREALAAERSGRPRPLGAGRLAAAALLPPGYLRLLLPAYRDATGRPDLEPRPYSAVAADENGALVVSALQVDQDKAHDPSGYARAEVAAKVAEGLRAHPGDKIVRQLARCAKQYGCHAAANAFFGRWDCALPIAAPSNEKPPSALAPKRDGEAEPTDVAAFHPSTDEIARLALGHLAAGGGMVAFGRACEGEPLLAAREVEDAIAQIRAGTREGTIHLATNGSVPGALRRLAAAGLDAVTFRVLAASAATYETLHGPVGYRFPDVRAGIRLAADLPLVASVLVLVHPGIFDRPVELAALIAFLADLPEGSALLLRDLHADPLRALALLPKPGTEVLGLARAIQQIRADLPRLRVGAFVRATPTKVSHVP